MMPALPSSPNLRQEQNWMRGGVLLIEHTVKLKSSQCFKMEYCA